ncbi:MAG: aminomethyl-transferring glycine dehydrogenase subunit GcvPA [Pseudomonadota bacterium]
MRYFPHTDKEIKEMLATIGAGKIEDLFACIPTKLRTKTFLQTGPSLGEPELIRDLNNLSKKNIAQAVSFLGAGAYRHYIPAAVTELANRSEFVTPYTPYQPEISQGTLQVIFEYQSLMCRIFEMDVCNASNYDAATSVAEAVLMAKRVGRNRKTICLPDNLHPEYIEVVKTTCCHCEEHGDEAIQSIKIIPSNNGCLNRAALKDLLNEDLAAVVVQYPNFFGTIENFKDVADMVHKAGGLLIAVVSEPLALGLLNPPGSWDADIAVGEGLSFGLPLNFGGPTLGIFTAKEQFVRNMPGRICGQTTDTNGKRGYVLTMSTREQHIRREKATSNICSNQAWCATTAAIYLSLLGKTGFRQLAELNFNKAEYAKQVLAKNKNVKLKFASPTFNEFTLELNRPANEVVAELAKDNIFAGVDLGRWHKNLANCLLVCVTEMNTKEEIDLLARKL